jgi:hypothetical protein
MTPAYFGHYVMKWGTGDAAAEHRIQTLTTAELRVAKITADIAEAWRLFYLEVVDEAPKNPSARGRAKLMECARSLLEEDR